MGNRIRIAIAGLGRIGWQFHAQQLRDSKAFVIAAVTDPVAERRAEAEAEFHCPAFDDFDRMLAETKLDAVTIATPTHLHKPMALAAFRRNLHVMLEKPMAVDAAEAALIVAAAKRKTRVLTVYQPHRLMAYFQQIKATVDSGIIGRVCRVQSGMFSFSRRDDWQSLRKYGGGMLNNFGAHGLDQLLQLVGYDVRRLFCQLQTVATVGDADDVVKVVLETRQGVLAELDICQASSINPYRMNIWGTCGGLTYEQGQTIKLRYFDPASLPPKTVNRALASAGRQYPSEPMAWQEKAITIDPAYEIDLYTNFAAAIRGKAPLTVPPEDTLKLMRLIGRLRTDAGRIRDFRT